MFIKYGVVSLFVVLVGTAGACNGRYRGTETNALHAALSRAAELPREDGVGAKHTRPGPA
eukprot:7469942-Pyramimonas_sp.AAC.1